MILEARKISKVFPLKRNFLGRVISSLNALDDVSLSLKRAETVGIIGETGSGKSTLAKILLDLEKPTKGSVLYKGKDIRKLRNYKDYRLNVQAVFQNPQSSLNPRMKIFDIISEGLKINFSLDKNTVREKVKRVLSLVGLNNEVLDMYPHQLSGGQRQRVAIARAVILDPEVIVADEPTSALDVSVQSEIINLLLDLQEKFSTSYVFISHSLPVVRTVSDRVMVMYRGFVVEEGTNDDVFKNPLHPYTRLLISSVPVIMGKKKILGIMNGEITHSGCPFYSRCTAKKDKCKEYQMKPVNVSDTHRVSCLLYS